MFWVARPPSNAARGLSSTSIAMKSGVPARLPGAQIVDARASSTSRVCTTTKRHGWWFLALPLTRPASRIRRTTSSGTGSGR
jgi:hypothetical protein